MTRGSERRRLGKSKLEVSPVALGCWPIAGMTSIDVNERDSMATLEACRASGINFLDTAYCYGPSGESERLIRRLTSRDREDWVIATKCGIHWNTRLERIVDGRPVVLRRQVDESLQRLGTDCIDLLYLHAPDPLVPVAESAGALGGLQREGKVRYVGASNMDVGQLDDFQAICPLTAVQPPYNMLQRQIERDILPWCQSHEVAAVIYWPLMKGLLAGRLQRDHVFASGDGRAKYPMFQGEQWERNQDFVDELRGLSVEIGRTVAQIVINWTIHQPSITVALCGAKRAYQISETAGAMGWQLEPHQIARIDAALARRGSAITRGAV
jgi:aryl-alcohol dehydrogenase-like predicted oxidoreductase